MNDDRHITARAVEMRFDDLKREGGGNGGVEGVTAFLQRRHADGGRDPVRRSDDAERAFDFRTRGERVGVDDAHSGGKITRRPLAAIRTLFSLRRERSARISTPRRSCNSGDR